MPTSFDNYAPFDSGPGANAMAAQWRKFMGQNHVSGVIADYEEPDDPSEMEVIDGDSGMQVKVRPGECWIRGHWGRINTVKSLNLAVGNGSNDRIDRVVARARFAADLIEVDVVQGTPSATPTPPPLTQNSTVWEIPLAQVFVAEDSTTVDASDITDERQRVGYGRWTHWTPTLYYEGSPFGNRSKNPVNLGTGSVSSCRYMTVNKVMHIRWYFRYGPESTEAEWNGGTGRIFTELPPGYLAAPTGDNRLPTHLWTHARDPKLSANPFVDMDWMGYSLISPLDNLVFPFFPRTASDNAVMWMRIAFEGPGNGGISIPDVEAGPAGEAYPEGGHIVISGTLEIV